MRRFATQQSYFFYSWFLFVKKDICIYVYFFTNASLDARYYIIILATYIDIHTCHNDIRVDRKISGAACQVFNKHFHRAKSTCAVKWLYKMGYRANTGTFAEVTLMGYTINVKKAGHASIASAGHFTISWPANTATFSTPT